MTDKAVSFSTEIAKGSFKDDYLVNMIVISDFTSPESKLSWLAPTFCCLLVSQFRIKQAKLQIQCDFKLIKLIYNISGDAQPEDQEAIE